MKTQNLNSKANIKQNTGADLPFSPKQPVIAKGNTESSLNQTVVNLPFTVDTINAQDSFFLIVDGKVLTIGINNDYTMTSIDSIGFSSQATLTQSITSGLNIQYYKLGLKKESEFAQDQRFVNVYESLGQGFQGFISQAVLMTPTITAGTPTAGTFYSTVVNRKALPDLRNDLGPRMGINRVMTQYMVEIQDEFGPNGERVFRASNDVFDRIRFVGGWSNYTGLDGSLLSTSSISDYVEITFYGTSLNLLTYHDAVSRDHRATVDGGTEGSNFYPTGGSNITNSRGYNSNKIINVASGLSLGVHTVKIRNVTTSSLSILGFEILNESSNIVTTAGTAYIQGKKASAVQNSTSYATSVTGIRGGRIVTYLNQDGTLGRAFRATNAAQANLTLADHTNEEVVRTYNIKEFGAGRADDFSSNGASGSYAFTLDDGTTSLTAENETNSGGMFSNGSYTLNFVGTGLDILGSDDAVGGADNYTATIDGVAIGNPFPVGLNKQRIVKIVSGLPYGTHTFKITRVSAVTYSVSVLAFKVYQPKKPTIPSGVIELADYNVMATYVANTTTGVDNIATGILRKMCSRELMYVGTWGFAPLTPASFPGGYEAAASASASYVEYTNFGTGFELRGAANTGQSNSNSLTINGLAATVANFPSLIIAQYGTGWTYTGNTINQSSALALGSGISFSGLPLGTYKVRMTANTANSMVIETFDIITPIHSTKSNVNFDLQNTLPVGSQGLSDSRVFTPVKDLAVQSKNVSQATGITSSPTKTGTTLVPIPDLSVTHSSKTGTIKVSAGILWSATNTSPNFYIFINGIPSSVGFGTVGTTGQATLIYNIPVSVGVNKVDVYWGGVSVGTATAVNISRFLLVEDI